MEFEVHFGGPDQIPGLLRDVLSERIARVPRGGSIDWITYYFRDRRLARDLIEAKRRGVAVRITLEGRPRTAGANDPVIAMLREALGEDLHVMHATPTRSPLAAAWRSRLHEKLYCFSHPEPSVLVGSFNPSSDAPETFPEVIEAIGDHDRGYNLLVEMRGRALFETMVDHARSINQGNASALLTRCLPANNRVHRVEDVEVHFWPRVTSDPVLRRLGQLRAGDRVRIAASHIKGDRNVRLLGSLVQRGVSLEILTDASLRRVPAASAEGIRQAGVQIARVVFDKSSWSPMHNKFVLIESGDQRTAIFGSFNWNLQSRHRNREIGVITQASAVFEAFSQRYDSMRKYAE